MLKDIRLHIENDESKQIALESKLAADIECQHPKNINAFARTIPSLLDLVQRVETQSISVFSNKFGEFNIVDYGTGRTLYGLHPKTEIIKQYEIYADNPRLISCDSSEGQTVEHHLSAKFEDIYAEAQSEHKHMPEKISTLVVMGIGLAEHILKLVSHHRIEHLVIYEPELQYFQCSVLVAPWDEIFERINESGTSVYFQLGKDGRDILADIKELTQAFHIDSFYLYQHYHHPIFDVISASCAHSSWHSLNKSGLKFFQNNLESYLPIWTPAVNLAKWQLIGSSKKGKFGKNIEAFKEYFPNIATEFENYQPKTWYPLTNDSNQINLIHKHALACWHSENPVDDYKLNYLNFTQFPNKDELVLGYTGEKLKTYLHYQLVEDIQKRIGGVNDETSCLPKDVKSLILFGLGIGYQLEMLYHDHAIDKLFICEPNRDFFYASLFAIDWAYILDKVDKCGARLYINIGDDGSNLFRDLLNQFYAIGPYVLANTYFYQTYHNDNLVKAVAQLREQLQVVISMGEYFDHARYGIAHTTETISRQYPFLTKNPESKLSLLDKSVPIFIVGNGPSFDSSISAIKEWQDEAIIVSCGTALMPLYKNGIVPDFHAEIEQNRTTFDWICRVGDFDYLKEISLLSCNGIHPDTCKLFKDVFIAFKEGESSTVSALEILGKENYEELKFAFPTVSNFALNLFTKVGFNQIYLLGVDLGFVDQNNHHSKLSGYYKSNGKEAYDYRAQNNTSIVVEGNFREYVFTKQEFKVSKAIIEQTLASKKVDCFNCSDGAKIIGALPLRTDLILISTSKESKNSALEKLKNYVFSVSDLAKDYRLHFNRKFQPNALKIELDTFIHKAKRPITSVEEAELFIEEQKVLLFTSYQYGRSLLFYYLYGTVNYLNAVLSKSLNNIELLEGIRERWEQTLDTVIDELTLFPDEFDYCTSFYSERAQVMLKSRLDAKRILVVTNSLNFVELVKATAQEITNSIELEFIALKEFMLKHRNKFNKAEHVIYYASSKFECFSFHEKLLKEPDSFIPRSGVRPVIVTSEFSTIENLISPSSPLSFVHVPGDIIPTTDMPHSTDGSRALITLHNLLELSSFHSVVFFKSLVTEQGQREIIEYSVFENLYDFYELNHEVILVPKGYSLSTTSSGQRARKVVPCRVSSELFILKVVTLEQSEQLINSLKADSGYMQGAIEFC